jgi:ribose transport system substrate-binding protein
MVAAMVAVTACSSGSGGDTNTSTADTSDAGDATTGDTGASDAQPIKVGFVVKALADQYWILVQAGAKAAAAENGVDLTFIAPNSESDVAKQVENIETLVAAGVDVLCVAPSNDETVLPALQDAVDAGIKVIAVDTNSSLPDKLSFIGTGNESAAREGALWAGEQVGEGATAIILRGRLGDRTHDDREAGLRAGLEEMGVEILTVEAADSTEEKGLSVAENQINRFRAEGRDVNLIITTADSMAVGAYNAVKSAGTDTFVYGFDGTIPVCELIQTGEILGSTAQSPYEMGVLGIENAIKAFNGETIDAVIDSGQLIVNSANVDGFLTDLQAKVDSAG